MPQEETDTVVVQSGVKLLSIAMESSGVFFTGRISWRGDEMMTSVPVSWEDLRAIGNNGAVSYESGGASRCAEFDAKSRDSVAWVVAFIASALAKASSGIGCIEFGMTWKF